MEAVNENPNWLQLSLSITGDQGELIEAALLAAGAVSVTLMDAESASNGVVDKDVLSEQAAGDLRLWDAVEAVGLFPFDSNKDLVLLQFCAHISPQAPPPWRWSLVFGQAWAETWKEHFQPIHCGGSLWVCPSWLEPPEANGVNVIIDPGMAFGTGTHATTGLCLRWLQEQTLEGATVLDFGCGSGVLAIAACMLGAAHVIAVDNDPQALAVTRENAARNDVSHQLTICEPENLAALALPSAAITLANILANPLIELAPSLVGYTAEGGKLCLSGILNTQYTEVAEAYQDLCELDVPSEQDGWLCLTATI